MNKTISVLIATYNGAQYIRPQLDSIVAQTIYPDEIIVIDDYSTDETVSILHEYKSRYSNFKIIQNSYNLGAAQTFFRGLRYCTGNYIAFSDQDDIWLKNKLETLVNNIGDNLLIYSSEILINSNLQNLSCQDKFQDFSNLKFWDYLVKNRVRGCCTMISRDIFRYGYPDKFYIHDHYFALLASSLDKIKFISDKLVLYRQHSANTVGVGKYKFDKFISNSLIVANSFNLLLDMDVFLNKHNEIEIMRDYRFSIAEGKFLGFMKIMRLLKYTDGIKLVIYYVFIGRLFGYKFSKKIYNFIHKL